jgi:hypothetical protein
MATTTRLTDPRNPLHVPTTATEAPWQRSVHPHRQQPAADPCRRRLNPVTVEFWLGGFVLGTGGAIVGACRPYRHPVAVTISVLWWGIFLGCFGGSIGALLGLWSEQTPASPLQGSEAAGKSLSRADSSALPPGTSAFLSGANRGSTGVRARTSFSDGLHGKAEA